MLVVAILFLFNQFENFQLEYNFKSGWLKNYFPSFFHAFFSKEKTSFLRLGSNSSSNQIPFKPHSKNQIKMAEMNFLKKDQNFSENFSSHFFIKHKKLTKVDKKTQIPKEAQRKQRKMQGKRKIRQCIH